MRISSIGKIPLIVSIITIIMLTSLIVLYVTEQPVNAHKSGCHRWHSCPSDTGSYVCGDMGIDTYCRD